MAYDYPKSISEAAKILDEAIPGWNKKINIDTLNMEEYSHCILGQLGGFYLKLKDLFGKGCNADEDKIFGWQANKQEWIKEIDKRKEEFTFLEALQLMENGERVQSLYDGQILYKEYRRLYGKDSDTTVGSERPCFFDFFNRKFKLLPKPLTFGELKVGEKFTTIGSDIKMKIQPRSDINAVNLANGEPILFSGCVEVKRVTD